MIDVPGTVLAVAAIWCAYIWSGFLTTLASRRGVSGPRDSRCPACAVTIPLARRAPVLGWLLALGRCRTCAIRVPLAYPAVETTALCALLSLGVAAGGLTATTAPAAMALGACALAAAVLLLANAPRRLVIAAAGCSLVGRFGVWALDGAFDPAAAVALWSAAGLFVLAVIARSRAVGVLGLLLLPVSTTGAWSVAWLLAAAICLACSRAIAGVGSGDRRAPPHAPAGDQSSPA